jgi:aldehyde dehydrogenase (NAD+)
MDNEVRSVGAFIDGASRPSSEGRWTDSFNPARGELIARFASCGKADLDDAVSAATEAFEGRAWRGLKPYERQRLLMRVADLLEARAEEFAQLETADLGAPIARSRVAVARSVQMLHWCAANAVTLHGEQIPNSFDGNFLSYTVREPLGVVGGIIPWNFPIVATVWKVAPVLATGCTLVLKPADEAALVPLAFAELCFEAGVPRGVVNVVTGPGRVIGDALVTHPGVEMVSFTGSVEVGREIMKSAAGTLKKVSLELGGKSPNVVFADADLDKAVPLLAMAAYGNSGQVCSAGTRLYVEAPVYDEVIDRVSAFTSSLVIGDGADAATQIGPLVSERHLSRVVDDLRDAEAAGARTVTGGGRLLDGDYSSGFYLQPTLLADVTDDMTVNRKEVFGPVLSAQPFESLNDVIARANDSDFGLGAGVWTSDVTKAHTMARELRAGSVWVNCYNRLDVAVPFGGRKMSGHGREMGREQFDSYLTTKAVWIES